MLSGAGCDGAGTVDGVPLITHLLLLRASVRFSLEPSTASTVSDVDAALLTPQLRIVSLYTQQQQQQQPVTRTPKEEAQFLEAHPSLSGLLSSLAAEHLTHRIRLRRLQTNVVQTVVKLTQLTALASPTEGFSALQNDSSRRAGTSQLPGVVAAAAATFVEDTSWSSMSSSRCQQPNPWCLLPVSAEGCYLTVPSPPFINWCHKQAMHCFPDNRPIYSSEAHIDSRPMRHNDIAHYPSAGEEGVYMHGYTFVMEGDVFTGPSGIEVATTAAAATAVSAMNRQGSEASSVNAGDEEASVLLWCVLSDAPVFNFMRSLTHGAVTAMCSVAQRLFHEHVAPTTSSCANTPLPSDVYTALLDGVIQDEVLRPLATELLTFGSVSSRTLPGETFTVPLAFSSHTGGAAIASSPPLTSDSNRWTFRRPLDLLYPHADVPLSLLLMSFNDDGLHVLLSLLVQEERVVVLGATPQHASACVVSLLALLSPLTWVSLLVPYLPPHLSAVTGLLHSLLKPPVEWKPRKDASVCSPSPWLASQRAGNSGFLIGSTAALLPYLILLSSSAGETGAHDSRHRSPVTRASRVWIADARTGCVGVCPEEPVARFSSADSASSTDSPRGSATTGIETGGAANASASRAHVRLSLLESYSDNHSRVQNVADLYGALGRNLNTAALSNVMSAAPLDLLPPFSDELHDLLRRPANADKRRLFRHHLEAVVQHERVRLESLKSMAARLARGLQRAMAADKTSVEAISDDKATAAAISRDTRVGVGWLGTAPDSDDGDDDDDDTSWRRATTEALTRLYSHSFSSREDSSMTMSVSTDPVPQFPAFPSGELWQVQVGVFDYMVSRFTGAYRRGLSATTSGSGGAGATGQRRVPKLHSSAFLVPGLDQRYALAERVAETHMLRHFECTVLAAEEAGLRHVLSGAAPSRVGESKSHQYACTDPRSPPLFTNVRSLSLFALMCCRARLHFANLYVDIASLDAIGDIYRGAVTQWFPHRRNSLLSMSVPIRIRLLAGGYEGSGNSVGGSADTDGVHPTHNRGDLEEYSGGGGGRRLRGFFSKVAKAVKKGINSGSGYGSSGRAREALTVCLPAAIACLHSFSVPLFSRLPVPPNPYAITTYSKNTPLKDSREKTSSRHRDARAGLDICTPRPQPKQWVLQQRQQQNIALDTEFSLRECEGNLRAADLSGGRAGYVSGQGSDARTLDAIPPLTDTFIGSGRGEVGTSAAAKSQEAVRRTLSETSLYICRALPFDIVHSFNAYEPLLRPVASDSAGSVFVSSKGGGALRPESAEAYMRVGLLCPSCVNVWHEGERRAAQRAPVPQSNLHPVMLPEALYARPSPVPSRLQPSLKWERPMETPTPPASLWSVPASPQPTAAPVMTEATLPAESWGVFTSGVPQDFTSLKLADPSRFPGVDRPQPPEASGSTSTSDPSLWYRANLAMAPAASNDINTSGATPHHRGTWDGQGSPPVAGVQSWPVGMTEAERPDGQPTAYAYCSDSGSGIWTTGAPLAPPMMRGDLKTVLSGTEPLSFPTTTTTAVKPAPRDAIHDLFAWQPVHSTVHTTAAERSNQQQEQQTQSTAAAHRPAPSLTDFFN